MKRERRRAEPKHWMALMQAGISASSYSRERKREREAREEKREREKSESVCERREGDRQEQ